MMLMILTMLMTLIQMMKIMCLLLTFKNLYIFMLPVRITTSWRPVLQLLYYIMMVKTQMIAI